MFIKMDKLLSVNNDAKTIKGNKKGVLTAILYLAPHTLSGYQVCPKASEGCKAACLFTAGRGIYEKIQKARINKTKWFFEDRDSFMDCLVKDIERLINKSNKNNLIASVRLNGTSDIAFEKIKCKRNGIIFNSIMEAFPEVIFYDYTAVLNRKKALSLKNYHLTFSLKENNDKDAKKALDQGYNLSVVMDLKRTETKPKSWSGYSVIDGDLHDIRFKEGSSNVIALHAKGKARHDSSGFVRASDSRLNNY